MTETDIAALIQDGLLVMLKLAGPLLMVMLIVGLAVAVLQAVTQINEATLAFVPKVLALGATLVVLGSFMFATLSAYTRLLFDHMVSAGGS
jgi:flagellar biosynthesis protein FliQ